MGLFIWLKGKNKNNETSLLSKHNKLCAIRTIISCMIHNHKSLTTISLVNDTCQLQLIKL